MEHVEGQAVSDSAWKAVVPSRHGEPNVHYFRTRFDAFAYMPFMEDYGALAGAHGHPNPSIPLMRGITHALLALASDEGDP